MPVRDALKPALLLLLSVLAAAPLCSSTAAAQPTGVGPDAVDALTRMSKTLAAKQFSFTSRTFRAYAGPNGEMLHIAHTSKITFRRPDRLAVSLTGDDGSMKLLYDGQNLVIYAAEQKKYASIPAPGGIDKALDIAEENTGIDLPLSDLLTDDPGKTLLAGVTSGGQVGTATIDGVATRHYFFVQAGEDLEWELWLEDNDRALPRRVAITYRSMPGRPMFIAELSDWNFDIQAPDSDFEFKPPDGVTRVELAARGPAPASPK
jgi:hypothetical protein